LGFFPQKSLWHDRLRWLVEQRIREGAKWDKGIIDTLAAMRIAEDPQRDASLCSYCKWFGDEHLCRRPAYHPARVAGALRMYYCKYFEPTEEGQGPIYRVAFQAQNLEFKWKLIRKDWP